jgi:hypothetical protein
MYTGAELIPIPPAKTEYRRGINAMISKRIRGNLDSPISRHANSSTSILRQFPAIEIIYTRDLCSRGRGLCLPVKTQLFRCQQIKAQALIATLRFGSKEDPNVFPSVGGASGKHRFAE